MILKLKNICKIETANIDLNGITVIAGENNTGKSTIGKILFCIFNSFYKLDKKIPEVRRKSIEEIFKKSYRPNGFDRINPILYKVINVDEWIDELILKSDTYVKNIDLLKQKIEELFIAYDENYKEYIEQHYHKELIATTHDILQISDNDIFKKVLSKNIATEFNGQINNIYDSKSEGEIDLNIRNIDLNIIIKNDNITELSNKISLNTEVIYIDDPFILDKGKISGFNIDNFGNHREHLRSKLFNEKNQLSVESALEEIIIEKKLDKILSKLSLICGGEIVDMGAQKIGYKQKKNEAILDIKNISTGLKTFVILKTLLMNNNLEKNGTIVLDEPEIHLHPQWQLLFAELIVLIQKEFNMHILLNTHSPYFLNAIEVYAEKHNIFDKCKFYMAENIDNKSKISDVTENIDKIYEKLAQPLQDLENLRYIND